MLAVDPFRDEHLVERVPHGRTIEREVGDAVAEDERGPIDTKAKVDFRNFNVKVDYRANNTEPHARLVAELARILTDNHFVADYKVLDDGGRGVRATR